MRIIKGKKPLERGCTLHDSKYTYMAFWKRQNCGIGGKGEERISKQNTEDFQGSKAVLYDTIWQIQVIKYFLKPT